MPHKPQRPVHRSAIFLVVLLVLILAHLVLVLVQSPSKPHSHLRVQGRWAAVRHSLHLPPLAAHAKSPTNLPPLSLHISSRFDLKRKRALEETEFSFADADTPPHLYFATDALTDDLVKNYRAEVLEDVAQKTIDATSNARKGKQRVAYTDEGQ
ncbi:hypothetical protein C8F04DRAFT_1251278 [Mycena alexandri]|uniref:Uncharacterized protein n=1 Tax=Mycena alexandri TaxID=1745969 RepID=A0AAD6TF35_9AGAR|nr:hypothetical protein C8F04DRAFT_1251278 [Mycena alexandri]